VVGSHNVEGMSGLEWVELHPWLVLIGALFAFKILWLLPGLAVLRGWDKPESRDVRFVILCIVAGFVLATAGVDTSRMVGFAFPAFLVALTILKRDSFAGQTTRVLDLIFLINLLLPSVSVGQNTGFSLGTGLYRAMWSFLFS
jgi:hypothetical protein